jgi:DNA-binding IclR family transcriptional regulator
VGDFGGQPLVTPTGRRLQGISELLAILDDVSRLGYAENDEETALGLHTIAVPVYNGSGVVLAAMSVCIPTSRFEPERRERIVTDLIVAGRRLSGDVAWLPSWNALRGEVARP